MTEPDSLVGLIEAIVDHLDSTGTDYALGGAFALAYWREPRATADVDLTVFVPPSRIQEVADGLRQAGIDHVPSTARRDAEEVGLVVLRAGRTRVDLFVPSEPFDFYEAAQVRRCTVPFRGRQVPVWSAEDLTVFKMLFDRSKDHEDVRAMLEHGGADFDREYVRRWLADLVGSDNQRIATFAALCSAVPPTA